MSTVNAKYISIWDGGNTVVSTDVVVDFDVMGIVEWHDDTKTYDGHVPADDGELDVLEEEKIVTEIGMEFTAMSSDEYENFGRDDEAYYDRYGNGIIVYNA